MRIKAKTCRTSAVVIKTLLRMQFSGNFFGANWVGDFLGGGSGGWGTEEFEEKFRKQVLQRTEMSDGART